MIVRTAGHQIFLPDSERDAGNGQKGRQTTYLLQTEGAEGREQKNSLHLDRGLEPVTSFIHLPNNRMSFDTKASHPSLVFP